MSWDMRRPPESGWVLIIEGKQLESLTWDYDRNQYLNSQGVPCGANWPTAKAACEAKAKKAGAK